MIRTAGNQFEIRVSKTMFGETRVLTDRCRTRADAETREAYLKNELKTWAESLAFTPGPKQTFQHWGWLA